jgi:hypothetical protein
MTIKEAAKVGAVIAVLGLILVALVAAGARYWWQQHGDQFLADTRAAEKQGAAEGAHLTDLECLDQAVARQHGKSSVGPLMSDNARLHACLEASRKSPGFCAGVPGLGSFTTSIKWILEQCKRRGLSESNCSNLMSEVQLYCDSAARKAKPEGTSLQPTP